jgi:hypothetical protein
MKFWFERVVGGEDGLDHGKRGRGKWWTIDNDNGQWIMDNGQWIMDNG